MKQKFNQVELLDYMRKRMDSARSQLDAIKIEQIINNYRINANNKER